MTDELALRKDTERAAQADALLRNELVVEAFTGLEATYIEAWKATPARDDQAREKLWLAVQVVGKVKTHLEQIVANGGLSQRELAAMTAKPKRFGIV